ELLPLRARLRRNGRNDDTLSHLVSLRRMQARGARWQAGRTLDRVLRPRAGGSAADCQACLNSVQLSMRSAVGKAAGLGKALALERAGARGLAYAVATNKPGAVSRACGFADVADRAA